jgi:uncharacterized protein YkwD
VAAVLVGVLLGVSVMAGVRMAPWWDSFLGTQVLPASGTRRPTADLDSCVGGSTCLSPTQLSEELLRLVALITGERARVGCRPVRLDSRLQQAAQAHADAIANGGRPSHIDDEQRTPQDRAESAGYHGRVQENLAVGLATADTVMDLWLDERVDPSLRTRLDNCGAVALGMGYSPRRATDAYGTGIWVLVLGQQESA